MRIGIYHTKAAWCEVGGMEVFYREIGLQLADRGHDVVFYSSARGGPTLPELLHENVTVVRIDDLTERAVLRRIGLRRRLPDQSSGLASWVAALRTGVKRHIEREVDVLLTSLMSDNLFVSRSVGVPVLYQFHGNLKSVGIGGRVHSLLDGADMWLANSETTAERIESELGVPIGGVVYPGVDLDRFSIPAERAEDPPRITFVGRLHREKGVQDLIRAFASMETDAELRIVGGGPHREAFESLADELGDERITFEGKVPKEELARHYREATVSCHPSHFESFCMTNVEAMAASTPVVTTDLPAIGEYAVDGENCRIVPVGDVDRLASVLGELLDSPEERARLGRNARETAERFSWESRADEVLSYCRQLVGDGGGETERPPATDRHDSPAS